MEAILRNTQINNLHNYQVPSYVIQKDSLQTENDNYKCGVLQELRFHKEL